MARCTKRVRHDMTMRAAKDGHVLFMRADAHRRSGGVAGQILGRIVMLSVAVADVAGFRSGLGGVAGIAGRAGATAAIICPMAGLALRHRPVSTANGLTVKIGGRLLLPSYRVRIVLVTAVTADAAFAAAQIIAVTRTTGGIADGDDFDAVKVFRSRIAPLFTVRFGGKRKPVFGAVDGYEQKKARGNRSAKTE